MILVFEKVLYLDHSIKSETRDSIVISSIKSIILIKILYL